MKRITALFVAFFLLVGTLSGCNRAVSAQTAEHMQSSAQEKPLNIVTTIFPEYDSAHRR